MTRHVQVTGLRPEHRDRYLELHAAVWPEIERTIRDCNIRDYSIHVIGDTLIGVFDYVGDDFEADMRRMAADERTREWWALTSVCQAPPQGASIDAPWVEVPAVWTLA